MNDDLLKYLIGFTQIKGIGPNLAKILIAYIGSPEGVFNAKRQDLEKIPGIGSVLSSEIVSQRENALIRAEKEIDFIHKNNIQTFPFTHNQYPFRLKECVDSPVLLYGKGNLDLNDGKFIGVIGTRKATDTGKENCKNLIFDIAEALPNAVIVSGLAYGVDICAHKAAVDAGLSTIGILGHGLDRLYPATHSAIATKMLRKGGLLTEYPSETNPDRPNFVQRNRIIAGMCDALIVVESNEKGGALITANLANDYNRDVFAFPGRVSDDASKGCNALIKYNKAALIESAEDVLRLMNWEKKDKPATFSTQTSLFIDLSAEEQEILSLLRQHPDGIQTNELAVLLTKPFSKISSLLLEMEFKNLVKCLPGNVYKIVK